MVVVLRGVRLDHRHSGRIRSTENNTQRFSRKNANTNDQPEIIVHVISHLQVSQIPKIKSKEGTGTWNPSRMTTFQGQSAKRYSNKKNFKSGQNQPNAIFIFITFRNHRQKILMLFHVYTSISSNLQRYYALFLCNCTSSSGSNSVRQM